MNLVGLQSALRDVPAYRDLIGSLRSRSGPLPALRLRQSSRAVVAAALANDLACPTILVTARSERAHLWFDELRVWMEEPQRVFHFADPDPLPYERVPWSRETRQSRLTALAALGNAPNPEVKPPIVIASARALMQRTISPKELRLALRPLRHGQLVDLDKLLLRWLGLAYQPVQVVDEPGTFSRRGGIVDIYPPNLDWPVRLELFGDEVDSLRTFDPSTQRTREHVGQVLIGPGSEALTKYGARAVDRMDDLNLATCSSLVRQRCEEEQEKLASGIGFRGVEFYLPYLYGQPGSLLDHLSSGGLLLFDDSVDLAATWTGLEQQADRLQQDLMAARELPPAFAAPHFDWQHFQNAVETRSDVRSVPLGMDGSPAGGEGIGSNVSDLAKAFGPGQRYGGRLRQVLEDVQNLQAQGHQAVFATRQAPRLSSLLNDSGQTASAVERLTSPLLPQQVAVVQGTLSEGWVLNTPSAEIHLLTDTELFGWAAPYRRRRPRPRPLAPEAFFSEVKTGDYVVHIEHGIGLFKGLTSMEVRGTQREYLRVDYAQDDRLFVPVHQADRLSRYMGAAEVAPPLHRLGTADWALVKQRARRAVADLADDLLELYAAREVAGGFAFSHDTTWQAELEAAFPYIETEDQLQAVAEVKQDMQRAKPMDRLVCGDVGYGKTEVALRAAFKAVMDGKQVAVLVPTTVLAQQHFDTFSQRLRPYPVEVAMLSRFRSRSQQSKIVQRLAEGNVDIVVGTHRLLSKDIAFKDLGLLVIDEEQRFGVGHKEKIKRFRHEVDVLTLTATPIPRTLYMSLSGVRDMSTINTPPEERMPIRTSVVEYDETLIRQAILRELDRGGQVYFVFNRVRGIQQMAERLRNLVPEATFVVGHGQMPERQLAAVMSDFAGGDYDVLVCTTIIQSGLDIPNVNTLIVHRADRFGLADLYQLRGRVGRSAQRAYAYLLFEKHQAISSIARRRLETIMEASELGAGFQIAMRDLEIRGAGELLGARQHGHIAAVGFDLYTRLLTKAVQDAQQEKKQVRGEEPAPLRDWSSDPIAPPVALDLPLNARLPEDYVPNAVLRLQIYRRMADLTDIDEIKSLEEELTDRFGPLPDEVVNLLYVVRIKTLCLRAGVSAISQEDGQLALLNEALGSMDRKLVQRRLGSGVRVGPRQVRLPFSAEDDWQAQLEHLLQTIATLPLGPQGTQA